MPVPVPKGLTGGRHGLTHSMRPAWRGPVVLALWPPVHGGCECLTILGLSCTGCLSSSQEPFWMHHVIMSRLASVCWSGSSAIIS